MIATATDIAAQSSALMVYFYDLSDLEGLTGRKNILTDKYTNFEQLGLSNVLLKSLNSLGYEEPTPIQKEAIPLVLEGRDLMGLAQTGTGKTAAFGLPLIQQLLGAGSKPKAKTIRALILSPTRELANQIAENLRGFVRDTHLRVATVVGGQSINVQQRNLGRGNDILVATPGRLLDHVRRKSVYLDSAKFLVLDEADQMLDLGFIHALRDISKLVSPERQTMLFSATMPKEIETLSRAYLNDPVRIEVAPPGKAADKIAQSVHMVHPKKKGDLLKSLLSERPNDLSLVFARTKHGAEKLMKSLAAEGFKADSIHGNKSQGQRDRAIKAFKSGSTRVLVATDVAARGIDISGVSHVYNYDLPEVPTNYVHRIGRTARAGAEGEAVAFCGPGDLHLLRAIEKTLGMKIEIASGEFSREEIASEPKSGSGRRGYAGKGNSGQKAGGGRRGSFSGKGARKGARKDGARSDNRKPWQKGADAAHAEAGQDSQHSEKRHAPSQKSGEIRNSETQNTEKRTDNSRGKAKWQKSPSSKNTNSENTYKGKKPRRSFTSEGASESGGNQNERKSGGYKGSRNNPGGNKNSTNSGDQPRTRSSSPANARSNENSEPSSKSFHKKRSDNRHAPNGGSNKSSGDGNKGGKSKWRSNNKKKFTAA